MRPYVAGLLCVAVFGCAASPGPIEPAGRLSPGTDSTGELLPADIPLPGEHEQGIYILGSFADTLFDGTHHFRVGVMPADAGHSGYNVSVSAASQGANLVATLAGSPTFTGADSWFNGMILNGVDGGQVKIVSGSVGDGPNTLYHLKYRPSIFSLNWTEYCGDPAVAGDPPILAVPLRGWYDRDRIHWGDNTITFSCENAVGKKCTSWGYPAGNAGRSDDDWKRHQACTLLANATYCVNGIPGTREETPIWIRDKRGYPYPYPLDLTDPVPLPGSPDWPYFEAGWSPTGPVCLSKLRWQTLPPAPCQGVLNDPRSKDSPSDALFCDQMSYQDMVDRGALLFNGSMMMDAVLHTWQNGSTGDIVQTIAGYYSESPGKTPPLEQDVPFGATSGYNQHLATEGVGLRNLPGSVDATTLYDLHMWQSHVNGDRVLAITQPTLDFDDLGFEVHTFKANLGRMLQLNLCRRPRDYYTTTNACSVHNGVQVATLGFVAPPP